MTGWSLAWDCSLVQHQHQMVHHHHQQPCHPVLRILLMPPLYFFMKTLRYATPLQPVDYRAQKVTLLDAQTKHSNCNFTNDIVHKLLLQGFQRGIFETHDFNCSVVCSDVHRDMIVCDIVQDLVDYGWYGLDRCSLPWFPS